MPPRCVSQPAPVTRQFTWAIRRVTRRQTDPDNVGPISFRSNRLKADEMMVRNSLSGRHQVAGIMQITPNETFVAIVDDDSGVRRALQRLLAASGFLVQTYANCCDFLRSLEVMLPDCLLLDYHLPDGNGIDVIHQLRQIGATFPTIVISANYKTEIAETNARAGAAAFLPKPVEADDLLSAIHRALTHRSEQDAGV